MEEYPVYIIKGNRMNPENEAQFESLVERAQSGEEEAFTNLYNLCFDKIYRFIYYRVSHKQTAEDLGEEVFLKAFKNITKINKHQSFEAWVYKIAHNTVIDYYRSKKLVVSLDEVENTLTYESNIIDTLHLEDEQKLLLELLKELPSDQQTILKLKFFEDLSNESIAMLLKKNEGAIRVMQHRALAKLKLLADSHFKKHHP